MPTIIVIIITVFLCLVVTVYIFKNRIVLFLDWILKVLVVICLFIALSSLFLPGIYKSLAQITLENAGILQTIRNIDSSTDLNKLVQPGEQILNDLGNFLTGSQNNLTVQTNTPGKMETEFYPGLVEGLGNIYIIVALILSLIGIIGAIYLSFTTSAIAQTQVLKNKYKKIEERLSTLEKKNEKIIS